MRADVNQVGIFLDVGLIGCLEDPSSIVIHLINLIKVPMKSHRLHDNLVLCTEYGW